MYTTEQIEKTVVELCTTDLAIVSILTSKGICTEEEYLKARLQAIHIIEQELAKKKSLAIEQMKKEYPNIMAFFEKFMCTLD